VGCDEEGDYQQKKLPPTNKMINLNIDGNYTLIIHCSKLSDFRLL